MNEILKQEQEVMKDKFKCIQSDCDGGGNIPYQVEDGVWEADQCQFHAEYLFPFQEELLASNQRVRQATLRDVVEMFGHWTIGPSTPTGDSIVSGGFLRKLQALIDEK